MIEIVQERIDRMQKRLNRLKKVIAKTDTMRFKPHEKKQSQKGYEVSSHEVGHQIDTKA